MRLRAIFCPYAIAVVFTNVRKLRVRILARLSTRKSSPWVRYPCPAPALDILLVSPRQE